MGVFFVMGEGMILGTGRREEKLFPFSVPLANSKIFYIFCG